MIYQNYPHGFAPINSLNLTKTNYILFHSSKQTPTSFNVSINSLPIAMVPEACILGVIIDQDLTFKSHILQMQKKLSSSLFIFAKITYRIPLTIAWSLYHSLFKSHLIYCILIWGNSCRSYLHPINILHNKFLKTLLFLALRTPTSQVYSQASVLSLTLLYYYFSALFICKSINYPQLIPCTLSSMFTPLTATHSHLTRASNALNLFSHSCSTTGRQNHISTQGALIWSTIPNDTKTNHAINLFKTALRAHLKKQILH